jgi:hypothetical protein
MQYVGQASNWRTPLSHEHPTENAAVVVVDAWLQRRDAALTRIERQVRHLTWMLLVALGLTVGLFVIVCVGIEAKLG